MINRIVILVLLILIGGKNCFAQDTVNGVIYTHLKGDFYTDASGNIYLRFKNPDPDDRARAPFWYKQTMPLRSWEKYDSLKHVIDLPTYVDLGPYAKDKRHVYYFISNSDGLSMRILREADAGTFKQYDKENGWDFGRDKNNIYYKSSSVPGCSPNARLRIYKSPHCSCYDYFTDGKIVYYKCKAIKGADPNTFKTIEEDDKGYEAEDINRKYKDGNAFN